MAVDPVLERYLQTLPSVVFDGSLDLPAERARERAEALAAPRIAGAAVRDLEIPGPPGAPDVPVRVYTPGTPAGAARAADRSAVLYLHGGGFVVGGRDTHDNAVRLLAERTGAVVASVDYRLAPEHRYPAAVDDVRAARGWLLSAAEELGAAPGRVALAGDSAGAFLALSEALGAPGTVPPLGAAPPEALLLVYPATGFGGTGSGSGAQDPPADLGLSAAELDFYRTAFFGGPPPEPFAAHLLAAAAGGFPGLPPTVVLTAEYDPLRPEGEALAAALDTAGIPVGLFPGPGLMHGFLRCMHAVPAARGAAEDAFTAFARHL